MKILKALAIAVLVLTAAGRVEAAVTQLNALSYARPDGSDQTANMQRAVNAAKGVGASLYVPAGINYTFENLTNTSGVLLEDYTVAGKVHYRGVVEATDYKYRPINVCDRGVDGTGNDDDTSRINAILAEGRTSGRIVEFPEGSFKLSDTLVISNQSVRMVQGKSILKPTSALNGKDVIRIDGTVDQLLGIIRPHFIEGITIDGTLATDAVGFNIAGHSTVFSEMVLENCIAYGFGGADGTGFKVGRTVDCDLARCVGRLNTRNLVLESDHNAFPTTLRVTGSNFRESPSGPGVVIKSGYQINFDGCTFESNAAGGVNATPPAQTNNILTVSFRNCWFENNGGTNLYHFKGDNTVNGGLAVLFDTCNFDASCRSIDFTRGQLHLIGANSFPGLEGTINLHHASGQTFVSGWNSNFDDELLIKNDDGQQVVTTDTIRRMYNRHTRTWTINGTAYHNGTNYFLGAPAGFGTTNLNGAANVNIEGAAQFQQSGVFKWHLQSGADGFEIVETGENGRFVFRTGGGIMLPATTQPEDPPPAGYSILWFDSTIEGPGKWKAMFHDGTITTLGMEGLAGDSTLLDTLKVNGGVTIGGVTRLTWPEGGGGGEGGGAPIGTVISTATPGSTNVFLVPVDTTGTNGVWVARSSITNFIQWLTLAALKMTNAAEGLAYFTSGQLLTNGALGVNGQHLVYDSTQPGKFKWQDLEGTLGDWSLISTSSKQNQAATLDALSTNTITGTGPIPLLSRVTNLNGALIVSGTPANTNYFIGPADLTGTNGVWVSRSSLSNYFQWLTLASLKMTNAAEGLAYYDSNTLLTNAPAGSDGQHLVYDAAEPGKFKWQDLEGTLALWSVINPSGKQNYAAILDAVSTNTTSGSGPIVLLSLLTNLNVVNVGTLNIITNFSLTNVTAKTIAGFDADKNLTNLVVGTDGQTIVADAAAPLGFKWTNWPSGGGGGAIAGTVIGSGTPEAAGVIATYTDTSGTNVQPASTAYLYSTGGTDWERLYIGFSNSIYRIRAQKGGSGTLRSLRLSAADVGFQVSDTSVWVIDSSGHLKAFVDGQVNIGESASGRPSNIWAQTMVTAPTINAGSTNVASALASKGPLHNFSTAGGSTTNASLDGSLFIRNVYASNQVQGRLFTFGALDLTALASAYAENTNRVSEQGAVLTNDYIRKFVGASFASTNDRYLLMTMRTNGRVTLASQGTNDVATGNSLDFGANGTSYFAISNNTVYVRTANYFVNDVEYADNGTTLTRAGTPLTAGLQATNVPLARLSGVGAGVAGDILYRDATGWTNLAKGTDGQVLKLASGLPGWGTDNNSGGGGSVVDGAFPTGWDSDTTQAASRNALFDLNHISDQDDDGLVDKVDLGSAGLVATSSGGVLSVATAANVTNTLGILNGRTNEFIAGDLTMRKPYVRYSWPIDPQSWKQVTGSQDGGSVNYRVLFTPASNQTMTYQLQMPSTYNSNSVPTLRLISSAATASSGDIVTSIRVMAVNPGVSATIHTDDYDSANLVTNSVAGTGYPIACTIPLTNRDSMVPGAWVKLELSVKDTSTLSGQVEFTTGLLEYEGQ